MPATVKCPTCGAAVEWLPANRFRPFCSERCQQIDLGAWASERYTIPVAEDDELGAADKGNQGPLN
jgi:endogenous inhibitor of DNA gyrase (YacG/DUF329 family)